MKMYRCHFSGGPYDGEMHLSINPVSNDDYALVAKDEFAGLAYFKYRKPKLYHHNEAKK